MESTIIKIYPTPTERIRELEVQVAELQSALTAHRRITEIAFRLACNGEMERDFVAYLALKQRLSLVVK